MTDSKIIAAFPRRAKGARTHKLRADWSAVRVIEERPGVSGFGTPLTDEILVSKIGAVVILCVRHKAVCSNSRFAIQEFSDYLPLPLADFEQQFGPGWSAA